MTRPAAAILLPASLLTAAIALAVLGGSVRSMTDGAVDEAQIAESTQAGRAHETEPPAPRFVAYDIFIDPAGRPLAAWQIQFRATRGDVKILGVENAEHPAYADAPPYYDERAMMHDRVVVGDFSTNPPDALPAERTRVTTIHAVIEPTDVEPEFALTLQAAATVDGAPLTRAHATFQQRTDREE